MTAIGLVLAVLVPLALAAAMGVVALRPLAARLAPWAPLPALASSLATGTPPFELETALLGLRLGTSDAATRAFLAFTAVLWLASGVFARAYLGARQHACSFWFFFLVTMAGNVGAILAGSVATFYVFYAVMTFAAYGLVVDERSDSARRAARTYLVMALGGEMLLVAAFLLVVRERIDLPFGEVPVSVARSPDRGVICALLIVGFGVKAGLVLLHLWLPLAHPVAPTPASAILSGTIIEVALLGWLRLLPLGVASLPGLGLALAVLGLVTALYGAAVGVLQDDPKVVLAYSSVSQMGLAIVAFGVALAAPGAAAPAAAAIVFFASHHATTKGSLFLGAAVAKETRRGWPARLVTLGLLGAALAIAGAPFTSGALAKGALTEATMALPRGASALAALLSIAAVGSTLLMLRFLALAAPSPAASASVSPAASASVSPGVATPEGASRAPRASGRGPRAGLWLPWLVLLAAAVALSFGLGSPLEPRAAYAKSGASWSGAWPVLAGVALAAVASTVLRRTGREAPRVPPGDVLVFVEAALRSAQRTIVVVGRRARGVRRRLRVEAARRLRLERRGARLSARLQRADDRLADFENVGALLLGLIAALVASLLD